MYALWRYLICCRWHGHYLHNGYGWKQCMKCGTIHDL